MIQIPSIKSHTTLVRKTLPSTKTHFGHFLQILKKGSPQKFLKNFSAKMPDLREKCAYIKVYDIIWSSSFLLFKHLDFEQNSWFFGPKSRSSVGGFPYQCRITIHWGKVNLFSCVPYTMNSYGHVQSHVFRRIFSSSQRCTWMTRSTAKTIWNNLFSAPEQKMRARTARQERVEPRNSYA